MNPVAGVLAALTMSAGPAGPVRAVPVDEAPPSLARAVERADAAAQALQRKLSARLLAAMDEGGAAAAIHVCHDQAATLTAEAARESGAAVGRTSDRLRNPANAPPPWAAAYVRAAAGKRAAEVRPVVFELPGEVGLLQPIAVAPACTRCHGRPDAISPEVVALLRKAYPRDGATGYAEGDHRGFVWVVVPR